MLEEAERRAGVRVRCCGFPADLRAVEFSV